MPTTGGDGSLMCGRQRGHCSTKSIASHFKRIVLRVKHLYPQNTPRDVRDAQCWAANDNGPTLKAKANGSCRMAVLLARPPGSFDGSSLPESKKDGIGSALGMVD